MPDDTATTAKATEDKSPVTTQECDGPKATEPHRVPADQKPGAAGEGAGAHDD